MNSSASTASLEPHARAEGGSETASWRDPSAQRISVLGGLVRLFQRSQGLLGGALGHAKQRRLRVTETVSLGEKRFVSIVTVDGVEYLVGGGTSSVSLLTALPSANPRQDAPFAEVVNQAWNTKGEA